MSFPLASWLLFSTCFLAGLAMLVEGGSILWLKREIIPLPTRIVYGLSVLTVGSQKSRQRFAGRTSPRALRTYGTWVLVSGPLLLVSCFVYLFTALI